MPFATEYKYLYRTKRWKLISTLFRQKHPRCSMCGGHAEVVDHKRPHKGNESLFFDQSNLQSLCKQCHDGDKAKIENGKIPGKDFVPNNKSSSDGMPQNKHHPWNK